jgi:3-methylfumaryl-CoA hydratase
VAGDFSGWIGRTEMVEDVLTPATARSLLATLDQDPDAAAGDFAPQSIHWCLAVPGARMSDLGIDGHPRTGGFLPPAPFSRRMWASSAVEFLAPIRVGSSVRRISKIAAVTEKAGSSGRLMFVDVDHAISANGSPAVRERQTIVYREARAGSVSSKAEPRDLASWTWQREVTPDEVMLFRYSALTFNGHRIHYDLPYATTVEGYAGLVVQGPLVATLLLDLCARQLGADALSRFAFRAVAPAFAGVPLRLKARRDGSSLALAAFGHPGYLVMTAEADIRERL